MKDCPNDHVICPGCAHDFPATSQADQERMSEMASVLACLLDHYLTDYEQNDGQALAGHRDELCQEAEKLVSDWRDRRDTWTPKHIREDPIAREIFK